jgi:hypothetical protein
MGKSSPRQLIWKSGLIVIPVILLAGLGLASLRNDRDILEAQARKEGERLAQQLTSEFDQQLGSLVRQQSPGAFLTVPLRFNAETGECISPLVSPPLPAPLDWEKLKMTAEQMELATAIRSGAGPYEFEKLDDLPSAAQLLIRYEEAMRRAKNEDHSAVEVLMTVFLSDMTAVSPTGLPLAPMAGLQLVRLRTRFPVDLEAIVPRLRRIAVDPPSYLTDVILEETLALEGVNGFTGWEPQVRRIFRS